jgi:glycosyltransferase involved in cell wall biosynthesis
MIKVSVIMITYNHEKYIKEAIQGILIQECDFEIEIIVADDKSPDETEKVITEIIENQPKGNWIKYTKHAINKGMQENFVWASKQCTGKYIAICEGDDHWTDPLKLQKQVCFLEANPEYTLSCHNAYKLYMDKNNSKELFTKLKKNTDISLDQIVNSWIIPTASFLFRRNCILTLPNWFTKIYSGDLTLTLLLKHQGKVHFFSEVMSIYRINLTGTSATATYGRSLLFGRKQHKILYEYFNKETNYKYSELINYKLKLLIKEIRFLELKEKGIIKVIVRMPITSLKKIISSIINKSMKYVKI